MCNALDANVLPTPWASPLKSPAGLALTYRGRQLGGAGSCWAGYTCNQDLSSLGLRKAIVQATHGLGKC